MKGVSHTRIWVFVAVLALTASSGHLAGQSPSGSAKSVKTSGSAAKPAPAASYPVPRTPWGDPDFMAVWSYKTITPLQRPANLGEKEFYTPEEAAKLDEAFVTSQAQDPQLRAGNTGTYQNFWFDRGVTDVYRRTSMITDPKNGRLPEMTPEAKKKEADRARYRREHPADSVMSFNPEERCIEYHGVPPVPAGYNNNMQIFQAPGYVFILEESIHDVRVIPLDGRPHLGKDIRHWLGDSRGHWEGNTLVVDTTNYRPDTSHQAYGVSAWPASENLHAIERYTRVGRDVLEMRFIVNDPSTYTREWTAILPMNRVDEKIYEYACHEGNHAMEGMLAGARADEAAAAAKAKK